MPRHYDDACNWRPRSVESDGIHAFSGNETSTTMWLYSKTRTTLGCRDVHTPKSHAHKSNTDTGACQQGRLSALIWSLAAGHGWRACTDAIPSYTPLRSTSRLLVLHKLGHNRLVQIAPAKVQAFFSAQAGSWHPCGQTCISMEVSWYTWNKHMHIQSLMLGTSRQGDTVQRPAWLLRRR